MIFKNPDYSPNKDFLQMMKETGGNDSQVPICNGTVIDFNKTPHLLVAGTTGFGKSCAVHSLLLALFHCTTPSTANFIFIDPKMTELTRYDNLPHRLMDPVYMMGDAFETLEKVRGIMMDRYNYMRQNRLTMFDGGPVYVVIDELSALVFHDKNVVKTLSEIAMLGRAAKIHLICSTQLPTRKVLSNQVVANFDAKLCLHCSDPISYRTVLGYTPTWTPENPGEAILWRSGREKHIKACYTTLDDYDYYINHIEVTTPALNWSFA